MELVLILAIYTYVGAVVWFKPFDEDKPSRV
jgi:hypothetical protein